MTVDPARRAARVILATIAREELTPGDRLGSERRLAEQLGVHRTALRRALDGLELEGRIRRVPGRTGGVFVSDGKVERTMGIVQGVPVFLRHQGFAAATVTVRAELMVSGPEDARRLGLRAGEPIYHIVRVRYADGVSLSLEHARMPARSFPGLLDGPLDVSLYEVLRERYGRGPVRADESIEGVVATAAQAELLDIAPGALLLQVRRVAFDAEDRPIESALDLFRADRVRVTVHTRGRRSQAPGRDGGVDLRLV